MGAKDFTLPSRVYDDGTFVRFHQEFLWDQAHVDELHSVTGSDGKYQHEFSRDVDKWNYLCQHYAWWTNLPDDGLHPASEESNYWWCDFDNDEEAEIVTYGLEDIQAGKWYYVTFTFKKTNTVGTLTLYTYDLGPDDVSTLTVTVESP